MQRKVGGSAAMSITESRLPTRLNASIIGEDADVDVPPLTQSQVLESYSILD